MVDPFAGTVISDRIWKADKNGAREDFPFVAKRIEKGEGVMDLHARAPALVVWLVRRRRFHR
jgi:hypothetical protein